MLEATVGCLQLKVSAAVHQNSKNVLLLVQNFETLMRLVVRLGTWKTLFNWKTFEGRGKKFCTSMKNRNLHTIPNNHLLITLVWLNIWKRINILRKMMCSSGVKEPCFIVYGGRRCQHSLHLIVVVGFINLSRVWFWIVSLEINVKSVIATNNRVPKLFTELHGTVVGCHEILDSGHHLSLYLDWSPSYFCCE